MGGCVGLVFDCREEEEEKKKKKRRKRHAFIQACCMFCFRYVSVSCDYSLEKGEAVRCLCCFLGSVLGFLVSVCVYMYVCVFVCVCEYVNVCV